MLITILAFVVVAGVVIILHEFGHFIAARLTGMRVKKFSIGFPPKAYSRMIGETEFSLSWIPLGGYVQIAGMVDESLDETVTGAPDEFMSKNVFQKVFVLSSGVLMNYLTALLLFTALGIFVGIGVIDGTHVGNVIEDGPAATAGILPGDEIKSVNGAAVEKWDDVVSIISTAGDTVQLSVYRSEADAVLSYTMPTELNPDDESRRMIGIVVGVRLERAGLFGAAGYAGRNCYGLTVMTVRFISDLLTGKGSFKQLSGPLGVAQLAGQSARQGAADFLFFIAYVSIMIGFFNLLPLPVLDGGHIVYSLIESAIRRPISSKVKITIQQIGFVLLIMLVLAVTYNDIVNYFVKP